MKQTEITLNETVPAFGYELLRNVLIPELLGNEQATILYWAGKNLARKYPLDTLDDIIDFFAYAGWGNLIAGKEEKNSMTFTLTADLISERLDQDKQTPFTLEAGFLAQQIETMKNRFADAKSSLKRGKIISITVIWDQKDPVVEESLSRSGKSRR
ncbi:MAG TPA: YslB family protein [Bacillales bacterium]|nr:YslB family protein [Bacillales bacterium]